MQDDTRPCCLADKTSLQAKARMRLLDLGDAVLQQEVLARLPFAALVALWHTSRACRRLVSAVLRSFCLQAETRPLADHSKCCRLWACQRRLATDLLC